MDRRRFLSLLGMGAAAAVAPRKAYSFLGGILRPRPHGFVNGDATFWIRNVDPLPLIGTWSINGKGPLRMGEFVEMDGQSVTMTFDKKEGLIYTHVTIDKDATSTITFVPATS